MPWIFEFCDDDIYKSSWLTRRLIENLWKDIEHTFVFLSAQLQQDKMNEKKQS